MSVIESRSFGLRSATPTLMERSEQASDTLIVSTAATILRTSECWIGMVTHDCQRREFVAAKPADDVAGAMVRKRSAEHIRGGPQQLVAGQMVGTVVDVIQVVDIDVNASDFAKFARDVVQQSHTGAQKPVALVQPRQLVGHRHAAHRNRASNCSSGRSRAPSKPPRRSRRRGCSARNSEPAGACRKARSCTASGSLSRMCTRLHRFINRQ